MGSEEKMELAERGWRRAKLRARTDWTRGDHVKSRRMGEAARASRRDRTRGPPNRLEWEWVSVS